MLYQTPLELRAAASPALLGRGCVKIIGLDAIKRRSGTRWPHICERVYARAEALLCDKLGPTDFFVRISDDAYLVTMPSTEPEDVNVICFRIAYDLHTSLLGQCDVGCIHINNASHAGENSLLIEPLQVEHIVLLAEKAGVRDLDLTPVNHSLGPALFSPDASEQFGASPRAERASSIVVEHHYVPVWSVPNEAITTYVCEPKSILTAGTPQWPVTPAQLNERERIQLELRCLQFGVSQLAEHMQKGNRFLLGIGISFGVLGSPSGRMEFLSTCRGLSAACRQYVDFTLTEVPPGVAHARLNDLVNVMRPFAHGILATVAPGSRDYAAYQGVGLRAIGFDWRDCKLDTQFYEQNVIHLARSAKALKLATFVYGVDNVSSLQATQRANIQFLSGPAVAPSCGEPRGMYRMTWAQVLAHEELSV